MLVPIAFTVALGRSSFRSLLNIFETIVRAIFSKLTGSLWANRVHFSIASRIWESSDSFVISIIRLIRVRAIVRFRGPSPSFKLLLSTVTGAVALVLVQSILDNFHTGLVLPEP